MTKQILIFIFTSLFINLAMAAENLVLSLGESRAISLRGAPTVWIQDKDILKAEGRGARLLVRAGKEGRTTLKVGNDVYDVQVLHPNKTNSLEDIKNLTGKIVGLQADIEDGDLIIKGRLYRLQDWSTLAGFARRKNMTYQFRAQLSEELQTEAQTFFQRMMEESRLAPQTVIFTPAAEIRINAQDMYFKRYQLLLQPFGIVIQKDDSSLQIAPTVKVEITVAEIKKKFSQNYGLSWPGAYEATILSQGAAVRGDLKWSLNLLETNGHGKILASPNILCRSGREAEFLAGGEFPVKVASFGQQSVLWKRYGIALKVKPLADAAGRISLSIETEVSSLESSQGADNIPSLSTHRVSSHFDLTKPQTIALSGLLRNSRENKSEGLPLLSRLPVLGPLFSSKDYLNEQSELVIFVRPTILKEGDGGGPNSHIGDLAERAAL